MPATEDLIQSLTDGLQPVRRLLPPPVRAIIAIILASLLVALLVWIRGVRADFGVESRDPAYLVQVAGAWLTGAAAILAAFELSLPDRSHFWQVLPIPPAILWLYGFAYGCLAHWVAIPFGAPIEHDSVRCLETIVMTSVPLGLIYWLVLRKSHPLQPERTAWVAALAVAGFADTAHLLIHVVEASALVLIINLVPMALIVAFGGLFGPRGLDVSSPSVG
jgi:hypothetical protein